MKIRIFLLISITAFLVLSLNGCAAMQKNQAMSMERSLAAAGFQMQFANTAEKLEQIGSMTQRSLVAREKDGQVFYTYADIKYCLCLYVGTEKAYQRFQKLAIEQNIARDQAMAAQINEQAMFNWDAWGPWGPWY